MNELLTKMISVENELEQAEQALYKTENTDEGLRLKGRIKTLYADLRNLKRRAFYLPQCRLLAGEEV